MNTAEMYNPETNVWTSLAPMSTIRRGCACAPLPNGNVLVVGGYGLKTAEMCELDAELRTPVAARAAALPPPPPDLSSHHQLRAEAGDFAAAPPPGIEDTDFYPEGLRVAARIARPNGSPIQVTLFFTLDYPTVAPVVEAFDRDDVSAWPNGEVMVKDALGWDPETPSTVRDILVWIQTALLDPELRR